MTRNIRLTAVLTHPIQYYSPWFRHLAEACPEIDLTVLYATEPTPEMQGVGFGRSFQWDVPLTEGYRCHVLRPAGESTSVHSSDYRGVDVPEIVDEIDASRPDVVLIPGWYSITLRRALRHCRRRRIPTLYRGDTTLLSAPRGWKRRLWMWRTRRLLRQYDGCLAVGTLARDCLLRLGVPPSRIFHAPHFVDNRFFAAEAAQVTADERRRLKASYGLSQDDFVALFVGKLEKKKRPWDAIKSVARLNDGTVLLMVGSGDEEAACRRLADELGVRVCWLGFQNQSQISKAYAVADCLVLPSDANETWGLVVNEAMATGLPCIVSDHAGCAPDLVAHGETGCIFALGDVDALASAIKEIRRLAGTSRRLADACRKRVAGYSLETATTGLVAACERLAKRPAAPRPVKIIVCCGGMVVFGGMERMVFEVVRTLRRSGAAVHCIVNDWENFRITTVADDKGATWSTGHYSYALQRTRNPWKWCRYGANILKTSTDLVRDSIAFRPTHVLMTEATSAIINAPALVLARLLGIRVIMRLGVAPAAGDFYRRLWRWAVNPAIDSFVCNSQFTQRELLACGIPARKVSFVYNPPPTRHRDNAANVKRDPRKLIFVGQIIPEKGLDILVEAFHELVLNGHDIYLDIVGELEGWESPVYSGFRQGILDRVADPDLQDRVRLLGWRDDVPELLAAAAIHCCPSMPAQREAFGIVNVEAKAAGTPSVVFPTGALPELITHCADGWICSDCTVGSLVEGLEYFVGDPARAAKAGTAAKDSLARFSMEEFDQAWRSAFEIPDEPTTNIPTSLATHTPDRLGDTRRVNMQANGITSCQLPGEIAEGSSSATSVGPSDESVR